jgi:hypothetical protein
METSLYQKVYSAHCDLCVIIQVSFKSDKKLFKCLSYLTSVSPAISSENMMPVAGTTFEAPS